MAKLLAGITRIESVKKYRTTDGNTHLTTVAANAHQKNLNRITKAKKVLAKAGLAMPSNAYVVSIGRLVDELRKKPAQAREFAKLLQG